MPIYYETIQSCLRSNRNESYKDSTDFLIQTTFAQIKYIYLPEHTKRTVPPHFHYLTFQRSIYDRAPA